MRKNCFLSIAVSFLAPVFAACTPSSYKSVTQTLDDVETFIVERPDSALAVLEGLDTLSLTSRELRARHSLLTVMALDKCYKDISTPGLLDPAVEWYEYHGSPDEKLKTCFYEGRIAQVAKDFNGAAVHYACAEEYAGGAMDMHAVGLLYEAISSIYDAVYNTDREKEYVEKALAVYKQVQDPVYESALGDLAMVYHSLREWDTADSLYRVAIMNSEDYPHSLALYLSNYAKMKVLMPDKDPSGTIALLNRKQQLSGNLSPEEASVYAYALALSGKKEEAEGVVNQLEDGGLSSNPRVEVWLCRMALAAEDYESAFKSLSTVRLWEDDEIRRALSGSVAESVASYNEMVAGRRQMKYRVCISVLIITLLLLSLVFTLSLFRKNRIDAERSRIMEVCSILEKEAAIHEIQTSDLRNEMETLRETVKQERVQRFRQAGKLQSSIWHLDNLGQSWIKNDQNLMSIKDELSKIYGIDESGEELVRRLDRDFDGRIMSLVEKLHIVDKPEEQLFLCCCLLDLPSDMVASRFGWTSNNARVKKSRLKSQIAKLGNSEYDVLFDIPRQTAL